MITVMLLGHRQEMKALAEAGSALRALAELLPDEAEKVLPTGVVEAVSISELQPGDTVLVRPGSRVPADGTILDGEAELDESTSSPSTPSCCAASNCRRVLPAR